MGGVAQQAEIRSFEIRNKAQIRPQEIAAGLLELQDLRKEMARCSATKAWNTNTCALMARLILSKTAKLFHFRQLCSEWMSPCL